MNRTRAIFIAILAAAVIIIGVSLLLRATGANPAGELTVVKPPSVTIRVLTALPVEPWVRGAADKFNAGNNEVDGVPVKVEIVAADGLTALGRWDRNEFGALAADANPAQLSAADQARLEDFPTAWIPDSRYLVELANASYKERLGRDVFLADGEYRAKPIATSLFTWGVYESRGKVLEAKFGQVDWTTIHDAAIAKGGWPELGGDPTWGFFKLIIPNPNKNVGGLAALIAIAGEYYNRTDISVADITNPEFDAWLRELLGSVTDFNMSSTYTVEDMGLFGYSQGDGGQLLESDLLQNMQGILTRWVDPLKIYYPRYVTWFDFPFTVWVGPETSALKKNAALAFERFLLNEEQQKQALIYGLRPANLNVSLDAVPESLFVKWKARGVQNVVPPTSAMRRPSREVLLALLRWFDLNVAKS